MSAREELAGIVVQHFGCGTNDAIEFGPNSGVVIKPRTIADLIIAAGYRKVEAGRDARETAQTLVSEVLKEHRHDDPRELNPTCGSCESKVATAITAAVEAQREKWWEFVLWLNGERGDFPERQDGEGAYYWRREMMKRAAAIREG